MTLQDIIQAIEAASQEEKMAFCALILELPLPDIDTDMKRAYLSTKDKSLAHVTTVDWIPIKKGQR